MDYAYYPGCSLEATNTAYDASMRAVSKVLGINLHEIDDWNCCGATMYMSVKELTSFAVTSRNLSLAEDMKMDIVAPCSACFRTLNKTDKLFKENKDMREKISQALASAGLSYNGTIAVKHALDVFVNDLGYNKIKKAVKTPLKNIKVVPYYGCQLVRPTGDGFVDDPNDPQSMDKLITTVGAENVPYPLKTFCCSGTNYLTVKEAGLGMVMKILRSAHECGADCIITPCPLCQLNLDGYQKEINKVYNLKIDIPVLFFTQLIGLALNVPEKELELNKLIVSPKKVLAKIKYEVAA